MLKDLINGYWNFFMKPKHVHEQASTRMMQCLPCLEAGACVVCGCKTPPMFYAEDKVCPKSNWDKMHNEEQWEQNKQHLLSFIDGYSELEYDSTIKGKAKIVTRRTKVEGKVSYFIHKNKLYIYEHRD